MFLFVIYNNNFSICIALELFKLTSTFCLSTKKKNSCTFTIIYTKNVFAHTLFCATLLAGLLIHNRDNKKP